MNNLKLLFTYRETAKLIGVSISTLYRWVRNGNFPRPIQLGPKRVAFTAAAIELWIAVKVESGTLTGIIDMEPA